MLEREKKTLFLRLKENIRVFSSSKVRVWCALVSFAEI